MVLGGTGPVGRVAGVLAALAGAQVQLSSRHGCDMAEEAAIETGKRFGVTLHGVSAGDRHALHRSLEEADIVFEAGPGGRAGPDSPRPVPL